MAGPNRRFVRGELFVLELTASCSTMARSFSLALNDLFKIDNSIADLDAAVSEKSVIASNMLISTAN
jgi:hypothetical protein